MNPFSLANYECVMEDETWYLVRNNWSRNYNLRHYCADGEMDDLCARYRWDEFQRACRRCGSLPSKEIQGMYVMLTGDMDAAPRCVPEGTKY
jgi:hypothetical protein